VVTAENGRLAVAAWAGARGATPFDVILMDVQMPVLGGFEATAEIRTQETATGAARTPIVALTARAMAGDREACLAAGMDAYLAKPLRPQELVATLAAFPPLGGEVNASNAGASSAGANSAGANSAGASSVGASSVGAGSVAAGAAPALPAPAGPAGPAGPAEAAPAAADAVDRGALLAAVGGDQALLAELVALFVAHTPTLLAEIDAAIAGQDARGLHRSAHTLKGSLLTFAARAAAETARALELMGATGDLADPAVARAARRAHATLTAEVARVRTWLEAEQAA